METQNLKNMSMVYLNDQLKHSAKDSLLESSWRLVIFLDLVSMKRLTQFSNKWKEYYSELWQKGISACDLISRFETVCRVRTLWIKRWPGFPEEGQWQNNLKFYVSLSLVLPQRALWAFTCATVHWANNQNFKGLLDPDSGWHWFQEIPSNSIAISWSIGLQRWGY